MPPNPGSENVEQTINTSPYAKPPKECDLVMKGGITSGVVYPPAILELAKVYRLRNIGGTSAGAIAATIAAAAEYSREQKGFVLLEKVQAELQAEGFLLSLFRPSKETRPLYQILLNLGTTAKKSTTKTGLRLLLQLTGSCVKYCFGWFATGAAIGIGIVCLYFLLWSGFRFYLSAVLPALLPLIFFGWLGGVLASGIKLYQIIQKIPQHNLFGLCTGMPEATEATETTGSISMTEWFHKTIQNLANRALDATPLTFQDLLDKPQVDHQDAAITLKMVTTNLSQSQPYVFPLETNVFLFKESEFTRLFPAPVVAYLVKQSAQENAHPGAVSTAKLPGYHFLPRGTTLPIIVAMRMSLSFPLLLSAVPLYTIKFSDVAPSQSTTPGEKQTLPTEADLQQHWFSDGGICSNFPIHFFDNWFPMRPTFGINLGSVPKEAFVQPRVEDAPQARALDPEASPAPIKQIKSDYQSRGFVEPEDTIADAVDLQPEGTIPDVYLPKANVTPTIDWIEVGSAFQFANAILESARNYRDTMQAVLPGYRERIVQIHLEEGEGGLNLAMDAKTIGKIQEKGKQAGQLLTDPRHFDFEHHQWVRLRVLLPLVERQLRTLYIRPTKTMYTNLFEHELAARVQGEKFPYARGQAWTEQAASLIDNLVAIGATFEDDTTLAQAVPKPEPVLRVTSDI
ncbi:MAG: patatin-like phospholipase family protein [Chloroflexi bacterium]|nr:patatin-like phospholipase family protein [Chloroflexota bacterium]